jgi:capsular polysaccharide biosynthesis protein
MSLIPLQTVRAQRLSNKYAQIQVVASQAKRALTSSVLYPVLKTQTFEDYQDTVPYLFEGYSPEIQISKLTLSNAKLIMFPKSEGVIIDCENNLIKDSMNQLGVKKRNPYLFLEKEQYYLKENLNYQSLEQCTICFDCASFNYYHLLLIYYPFLILANQSGENQALAVSNLSEYKKFYKTSVLPNIISELVSQLPLQNGNQLLPLTDGIYQVKQLDYFFVDVTKHQYPKPRISLIFHDLIRQGFANLKSTFSIPPLQANRRIYISRQKCRSRTLVNETEINPILEKYEFETVFLEDLTLQQQIETFSAAKIIIATHGAGLSNLVFSCPETILFELVVEGDERPFFLNICAALGMKYTALACPAGERQSITINPQDFEAILAVLVAENLS